MRSWKGLSKLQKDFEAAGVEIVGASADSPSRLARFRRSHDIPYRMIADPHLKLAEYFSIPTSSGHPRSKAYPEGAFLQPAYFIMRAGDEGGTDRLHSWVQKPGLLNIYGAMGRPSPAQMLKEAQRVLKA
ncbi:MAG: redoxin domain-containing protein [Deltaproteobacteria bacterium]